MVLRHQGNVCPNAESKKQAAAGAAAAAATAARPVQTEHYNLLHRLTGIQAVPAMH